MLLGCTSVCPGVKWCPGEDVGGGASGHHPSSHKEPQHCQTDCFVVFQFLGE